MAFNSLPVQGYWVRYGSGVSSEREEGHLFCGSHTVANGDCPNCRRPLLRFLSLHTQDPRIESLGSSAPELPLLFCWTCNLSQEPFFYRLPGSAGIELIRYGVGGAASDFPYEDYPIYFPGSRAVLVELSGEEQETLHRINLQELDAWGIEETHPQLSVPHHQVGGEPYLVQRNPEDQLACVVCGQPMPFLAAIADAALDPRGFTGNPYVQVLFHYCTQCQVIGAFQVCD
jgi:hypothetical protein